MNLVQSSQFGTVSDGTVRIAQTKLNTFFLGLYVALIVGAAANVLSRYGTGRDGALAITTTIAVLLLVIMFPERVRVSRVTAQVLLLGAIAGFINFVARYYGERIQIASSGTLSSVLFFLNGAILAPIYEEMIVRRFMYFGAARWIGGLLSAILVSFIFAITHQGMMGYAFFFSLWLCLFAHMGMSTFDRSVLHGAHNLVMQALFFSGGLHAAIK